MQVLRVTDQLWRQIYYLENAIFTSTVLLNDDFLSFMFSGDFRFTDDLRKRLKQKIGFSFVRFNTYNSIQHISTYSWLQNPVDFLGEVEEGSICRWCFQVQKIFHIFPSVQ